VSVRVVGGEVKSIALSNLRLDWENPRLPDELRHPDSTQEQLALYLDEHFDPIRVGESISRHGFFVSEPLIALAENSHFRVVEGNRRLTALLAITGGPLRTSLIAQTPAWDGLETLDGDIDVPVVLIQERSEVDALLGFRHISGIEPWDPFAQARFIARLAQETQDFEVVADRVGRELTTVRAMYRDHDIVEQARDEFDLDTSKVEESFGVFSYAMGIRNLREYIGAPAPRFVDLEYYPVPETNKEKVRRLFTYMFGDERNRGRVITDSRQLRKLGAVLADTSGAAERELRSTNDLDAALEATVRAEERARRALTRANALIGQTHRIVSSNGFNREELLPDVDACLSAITELRAAIHSQ